MNRIELEALADRILNAEEDFLDSWEEAAEELTKDEAFQLALMLDICPLHHRDIFICADDDAEACRAIR